MKVLDTPILVALLRGDPGARRLLKVLRGDDLAATEASFLELETLARADRAPGRERRLASLARLRRRLSVLSIDEKTTAIASAVLDKYPRELSVSWALIIGSVEAHGGSELITTAEFRPPKGSVRTPLRLVAFPASKTRK